MEEIQVEGRNYEAYSSMGEFYIKIGDEDELVIGTQVRTALLPNQANCRGN